MCAVDGADGRCEVWQVSEHKARKDHKCSECARTIGAGEKYRNIFSVFQGDVSTAKVCAHCTVAENWLSEECGGFLLYGVHEDMREHAQEYRRLDIWRVVRGMERQWQRFDKRGLMPTPRMPKLSAPVAQATTAPPQSTDAAPSQP